MPEIETLQVLIFLAPGLFASILINAFAFRKERKELSVVIEGVVLSIIVYGLYSFVTGSLPVTIDAAGKLLVWHSDKWTPIILAAIALLIGLLATLAINKDWHTGFARRIGLSTKSSRASLWLDMIHDKGSYVVVNFANGNRLYGQVTGFSDDPSEPWMYIHDPWWLGSSNGKHIHSDVIDGIMVTPNMKIEFIQFLDSSKL